jgi:hypothetical protein
MTKPDDPWDEGMRFRIRYRWYMTDESPRWAAFYEKDYVYASCYCEAYTLEDLLRQLKLWYLAHGQDS